MKMKSILTKLAYSILTPIILLQTTFVYADDNNLGGIAKTIVSNFANLARLITAGSYIAGMGFAVGAILKFKAHKDNPTQIPIGTPIALIFIAAALIFLPSIFKVAGYTLFSTGGTPAGVSGTISFTS
ncbi:MAG: type IV secretion protein IcmD [Legionellales bacterium]|nr:type IV secretion protein IcmD [Legionellales bacterium]